MLTVCWEIRLLGAKNTETALIAEFSANIWRVHLTPCEQRPPVCSVCDGEIVFPGSQGNPGCHLYLELSSVLSSWPQLTSALVLTQPGADPADFPADWKFQSPEREACCTPLARSWDAAIPDELF